MAARTPRFGFARLALAGLVLMPVSWAVLAWAQDAPRTPSVQPAAGSTAESIRREIERQQQRHDERIAELQALRDRIAKETSDDAKADLARIHQLIAREREDHAARMALLRELLAADRGGDADREWGQLASAVRRLNQSYVVAPVVSPSAATGGSYYIDINRPADEGRISVAPGTEPGPEGRVIVAPRSVRLPPPVYVGPSGVRTLPRWLYGDLEEEYSTVDPALVAPADEVMRLRQTVRELTREVQELRNRTAGTAATP